MAGLGLLETREPSCFCRKSNLDILVLQAVAFHYADSLSHLLFTNKRRNNNLILRRAATVRNFDVFSLTIVAQPLPKRLLQGVRSSASSLISSLFLFPQGYPSSCLRLLPRPFYLLLHLSFSNMFQKAVPTQDVTNPVSLLSFYVMQDFPPPLDST